MSVHLNVIEYFLLLIMMHIAELKRPLPYTRLKYLSNLIHTAKKKGKLFTTQKIRMYQIRISFREKIYAWD